MVETELPAQIAPIDMKEGERALTARNGDPVVVSIDKEGLTVIRSTVESDVSLVVIDFPTQSLHARYDTHRVVSVLNK